MIVNKMLNCEAIIMCENKDNGDAFASSIYVYDC